MSLPGLNSADTLAMASAFCASKISNSDINWDKATILMGSKSIAGARERIRVAKKKAAEYEAAHGSTGVTASSVAPVGGIDKKSPSKVKTGPKKAIKAKSVEKKVKEEPIAAPEDSALGESMDDEEV